jgi:uncharacterized damage-inducible protein DinB
MTIIERLLRHDAGTTRALLLLSAELPDSALDREFDIGHRSLRKTLAHIVGCMECWCDLMTGKPQRRSSDTPEDAESIFSLTNRLDIVSGQLLVVGEDVAVNNREEETFIDYLDNPARKKPLGAGLVHIATHGMHHRAQCLYMMRQLGMKNLPEGDALSWERAYLGLQSWPDVDQSTQIRR